MTNTDKLYKLFETKPDEDRDQLDHECADLELNLLSANLKQSK